MAKPVDATNLRWMSLSAAAQYVGVHPSTLREWAEHGLLPHLRTPGGHRRFTEIALQDFIAARSQAGVTLAPLAPHVSGIESRALAAIHGQPLAQTTWHAAYDPQEINQKREQGRRLLGLALHFVSRQSSREAVLAEAEEIGREYGRDAVSRHISLSETVRAFFFFRDSLLRATGPVADGGRLFTNVEHPDDEAARLNRDLQVFLDAVLYAMLDTFEALSVGGNAR